MKQPLRVVLVSAALLVPSAAVWAQDRYVEGFLGGTRGPSVDEAVEGGRFSLDPEIDIAIGLVVGSRLSEAIRAEAEVAYAQVAWDAGGGVGITADGLGLGSNLLYAMGSPSAQIELGIGAGWTFFGEACAEEGGVRICADAGTDDWTVQWIVGASVAALDNGAFVARYRMKNIGGFSADDRLHVFTVGYRHNF